jgi:staphylococcal nuclease domain-containing protein 1
VKDSHDDKNSSNYDELVEAEEKANKAQLGVHTKDSVLKTKSIRHFAWTPTAAEIKNVFTQYQNQPVKAIVEYVRDGASFRIYLKEAQVYLSFSLAGVLAPRINSGKDDDDDDEGDGKSKVLEPYALQSKHFTELRVLCRELDVIMESYDPKTSVILGSMIHPKGNIAVELVRNGLARIAERSLSIIKK